jgi:hypothetical protein
MTHPTHVTDPRSNANDQIVQAVKVIGRSNHRRKVFEAIYFGKRAAKGVTEIAKATRLTPKQVLMEGRRLADSGIVAQVKVGERTGYGKDPFFKQHKDRILSLVENPARVKSVPTKTNPRPTATIQHKITFNGPWPKVKEITINNVDSFKRVLRIKPSGVRPIPMAESRFKGGVRRILGEVGTFKDWGGERNDLFSTRLQIAGRRRTAAFAFKGKGKKGKLTPGGMGKNGDQIQRLFFQTTADVLFVQYWGQVDESVYEQMKAFASAKSSGERRVITYGVIDGTDSARLIAAYPERFR